MAKTFMVFVDCSATKTYLIDAESAEEARNKVDGRISGMTEAEFFAELNKECTLSEINVSDTVWDDVDDCWIEVGGR